MFAQLSQHSFLRNLSIACVLALVVLAGAGLLVVPGQERPATGSAVPTARQILGPTNFLPLADEPPAKLIMDPPLPDALAKGIVMIQYRTENLRVLPVFGAVAAEVSPRIGHLHVVLDDTWHWAHSSGQELVITGLPPGPHKIAVSIATANHKVLGGESVAKFEVPKTNRQAKRTLKENMSAKAPKLIVEAPPPKLLATGHALIRYRTENLQIAPVVGTAALAISPPVGHLHVYVDDAPWHLVDASGGPLWLAVLSPGPHRVLVELADANHQPLDQKLVAFEVPER